MHLKKSILYVSFRYSAPYDLHKCQKGTVKRMLHIQNRLIGKLVLQAMLVETKSLESLCSNQQTSCKLQGAPRNKPRHTWPKLYQTTNSHPYRTVQSI